MSVIGAKVTEFAGKITSVTMTETGAVVNSEVDAGPFGMVQYTVTFGHAVDAAGTTGQHTIRGKDFPPMTLRSRSLGEGRGVTVDTNES